MSLIEWSEKYSVKNFLIDNQHKKLIGMINEFHSAMKEGKTKNILCDILDGLIIYTKEHFRTEERMMHEAGYKFFMEHKTEHEKLITKVTEMEKKLKEETLLTFEMFDFLQSWLIKHIEKTDKKYSGLI